ncbi:hypothetical protein [Streptomyces sp. NPDC052036]|uniref:hypothetical protein n=1 Tax=Streptomyces sp. NPDC052036 TaxID=3155171 RepID=UPI00341D8F8F
MPKTLVWDNEAGVGKGRLTSEFAAFAGLLATRVHLCRPRDPEAKGVGIPSAGQAVDTQADHEAVQDGEFGILVGDPG